MRLSLIFELLLIFVLVAFAASAAAAVPRRKTHLKHNNHRQNQPDSPNRYCSCSSRLCNCCREFNIPVVSLQGPGCASLQYLKGDRLALSLSYGERVLTNTTISSRKPKPICMPLPGGVSKFCGRVYNIGRRGKDFNACLGLELRALQDVEASLRVACFRFGSEGLRVEPSEPLPVVDVEDDDDDEDDDEEDDDDDDDGGFDFDAAEEDDDDSDNDVDSEDYGGFSVFGGDLLDSFLSYTERPAKRRVTTRSPPLKSVTKKPTRKSTTRRTPKPTRKAVRVTTAATILKTTEAPVKVKQEEVKKPVEKEKVTTEKPMLEALMVEKVQEVKENETVVMDGEGMTTMVKPMDEGKDEMLETTAEMTATETTAEVTTTTEKKKTEKKDDEKKKGEKPESNDVFDEIIDGVVDTIAGSDEAKEKNNGTVTTTASSSEEDDDDDDDDDEEDSANEEEDEDDDDDILEEDDENEEEARSHALHRFKGHHKRMHKAMKT